jgi:hypothetical protein
LVPEKVDKKLMFESQDPNKAHKIVVSEVVE